MKTRLYLIAVLSAAVLTACDIVEFSSSKGEGSLLLDVTTSEAITRAGEQSDLLSTASVKIYMADFSGMVRSYTYADAPSVIYLASGDYRVDVEAGESVKSAPAAASWTSKSYRGSAPFSIVSNQTTNVSVEASVCNAVTNVSFDPTVAEAFASGYSFVISIADNPDASLTYKAAESGKNGYFIISDLVDPSFAWTFSGTLSKTGESFTKTGSIEGLEPGKLYKLGLKYTVKDGDLSFDLLVDYSTDIVDDTIIFEPLSTGLSASSKYEIWAAHATLHADVDESEYPDPAAVKFAISANGSSWTTVDAVRTSEGAYSAVPRGLSPETTYTYKLVIGGTQVGDSMTFTTESAPAVPNGSFENVSLASSGASYYVFYDPSCSDVASQTMWWGSGNGTSDVQGSASMGIVITVPDNNDKVDGSRSVCLTSKSIVGMLAAGNLFSGKFMGLVGTSGGKVAFGRPWTARPTALKCWVKYSTDKVNIIKSTPAGVTITKSDYDKGMVRIALGNWNYRTYGGTKESPILINTTDASTIIDFTKDPGTIAFGEQVLQGDSSNSTNSWREITIPLEYYSENEYPTHIVISCASSYYGDYFTGCDSSKLWVDKVELIYE